MFRRFAKTRLLKRITFTGYKLDEKRRLATQMLCQLVATGMVGRVVSDSRDKNLPNVRLRINVWDSIIAAGLARLCLGSEQSGKTSRYQATGKLLRLKSSWELQMVDETELVRNTEMKKPSLAALVVIHSGKTLNPFTSELLPKARQKKPYKLLDYVKMNAQRDCDGNPDPRAVQNGMEYFRETEDLIERINRSNMVHGWMAFKPHEDRGRDSAFQPDVRIKQVHAGTFGRAVRLYTFGEWGGQGLSKEQRRKILIDGEAVAELDYSGMVTRMLYHLARHDPERDVYRCEALFPKWHGFPNVSKARKTIVRDFIKKATNACWNVVSRLKAEQSIRNLLRQHEEKNFLYGVIRTEEIDPKQFPKRLIDRLMKVHDKLRRHFFTEVGVEMMTLDGKIMLRKRAPPPCENSAAPGVFRV